MSIAAKPITADELFAEATRLRERGKWESALKILRKLHTQAVNPTLKTGYCAAIGSIHWERSDWRKAVIWFRKAIQISPRSESASLGLFHALWDANRRLEALDEVNRFVKVADSPAYREILRDLQKSLGLNTN